MSRVFVGFRRKLVRTKNQQSTYKARKHNGRTVFSRVLFLLTRAWTEVISTLSYRVYPLLILLPRHLRQLPFSPPPPPEYASPSVLDGILKHMTALPPNCQTRPIQQWRSTPPILTYPPTTAPPRTHPSSRPAAFNKDLPLPPQLWQSFFRHQ